MVVTREAQLMCNFLLSTAGTTVIRYDTKCGRVLSGVDAILAVDFLQFPRSVPVLSLAILLVLCRQPLPNRHSLSSAYEAILAGRTQRLQATSAISQMLQVHRQTNPRLRRPSNKCKCDRDRTTHKEYPTLAIDMKQTISLTQSRAP